MASIDEKTLEKMVKVMKENGVLHFQQDGLVITLDPSRCFPEEAAPPPKPPIAEKEPRGNDGLTKAEQVALYGSPLDAE